MTPRIRMFSLGEVTGRYGKEKDRMEPGDNFLAPLNDGTCSQGQVPSYEPQAMNSAVCAFSSLRHGGLDPIPDESLIAILFVTRDLLDSGRWHTVNNGPMIPWEDRIDIGARRKEDFIGTKIQGSFNAATFLNAYHKLLPWNAYFDPEYLDKLLISRDRKPADVLLK